VPARTSTVLAAAASWVVTGALCVGIAALTGVELAKARALMPYFAWVLLAPAAALWARRHPPVDRRGLLIHLASLPVALVAIQVTFRVLYFLLTGVVELPEPKLAYLVTAAWVAGLLYAGTVWPVAALANLARARQAELLQAELEAESLEGSLDLSLARLGPHDLDALLGRVRSLVASSPARADEALDALGRYLRMALRGVEAGSWTLRREIEMAQPYLEFESACSGRRIELQPPGLDLPRLERPVRQHAVISAVPAVLPAGGEAFRLALAEHQGGLQLSARPLGGDGVERTTEVDW
jgi:hypothetical protein